MRLRFVLSGFVVLFVVVAIATGFLLRMHLFSQHSPKVVKNNPNNAIIVENKQPGTNSWIIPSEKAANTQIQAYANKTSVSPNEKLVFYVSTQQANTPYSIYIYRLGWYAGSGARLMASQTGLIGKAQGYYDNATHQLLQCTTCTVDVRTGLVEAKWQPSYTVTTPSNWTSGVYLAKFTDSNGMQTYAPFDVHDSNSQSVYIAVTPDTTNAAYNDWGEYSLYRSYDQSHGLTKGTKVSFDRPNAQNEGASQIVIDEVGVVHWMERQGYDLSYMSDVDLHENSTVLTKHHVYISLGHDEYWTKEMRDGVEHARDNGVNLAFFGANAVYWQMRFEPDSTGVGDRTIVCYKVDTKSGDLANDPFYGKDNPRVTSQWRDPVVNRPENSLIGIMYSDNTQARQGFPWQLTPSGSSPLLDNTGLQQGKHYGCGIVGNEWDRVTNNGHTPPKLQVIGTSPVMGTRKVPDVSNTTYYITSSGTMVFATGAILWTIALDDYRYRVDKMCVGQPLVVPELQKLMVNVMNELPQTHGNNQLNALNPSTNPVS